MDRLERERLRALEEESLERKRTIDSDQTIQNLDQVQYIVLYVSEKWILICIGGERGEGGGERVKRFNECRQS